MKIMMKKEFICRKIVDTMMFRELTDMRWFTRSVKANDYSRSDYEDIVDAYMKKTKDWLIDFCKINNIEVY